jgi:hypothetical protein
VSLNLEPLAAQDDSVPTYYLPVEENVSF